MGLTRREVLTRTTTVRLCGINAPEMSDAPAGAAARDALRGLVLASKNLVVRVPQKALCDSGTDSTCDRVDKYGRLLGAVLGDGVDLGARMLATGHARPYMPCR